MPHDQLRLDLVDRVHSDAHDNQQRCAAEIKIHAQPVQKESREVIIDPVTDQRQALQGKENPPGSGRYPEPKWLGMVQHDMMLFDHGMP